MSEQPLPPAWVCKRDGARVPFDADKISQALFAATETLGQPDAFLARELTDGALHFLGVEKDDDTLTTAQIAEIVGKTVRELGQPALAEAFAAHAERKVPRDAATIAITKDDAIVLRAPRDTPPRVFLPELMRDYTRQAVFSRQVLAAQSDGLLELTGLDSPGELQACVVGPFDSAAAVLQELRRYVGGRAVFDGPEYALIRRGGSTADTQSFVRELCLTTRMLSLGVDVNLNCTEPPSWAGDIGHGPLFAGQATALDQQTLAALADSLLSHFASSASSTPDVRVFWHLGERDFQDGPAVAERLRRAALLATEGAALVFVFDRPRRPLLLSEGMDRLHSATLLTVPLQLPRLAVQPGSREDAASFLQKLSSLTRLAVSAGVQKREYLRRLERVQPSPLTTGFLLDRARLVVVPIGLTSVVQQIVGRELTAGGAALDFARQILTQLRDVLKQESRTTHLDACVDGSCEFAMTEDGENSKGAATLKTQLRAAGSLHAVAEGKMTLTFKAGQCSAERIAAILRQACETSEVAMLEFRR